jgi:hypothetical protein
MPSLRGIGTAVRLGRDPRNAPFLGVVICAALSVGAFSAPFAAEWLQFEYGDATGIVGWPAANRYPIQQDVILFVLAVVAVPLLVLSFWSLWVGASWLAAREDPRETAIALALSALSCLWFCPLVAAIPWSRRLSWQLLALAAFCAAATFAALRRVFRGAGASWAASWPAEREPTRAEGARSGRSPDRPKPGQSRRGRSWGWRVLAFVVVPVLIYTIGLNPDIHGPVDLFHEGERLVPLDAMRRGGVPYRHFHLQHGLLENALFPLLAGKLFGHSLEAVRTMQMVLHPLVYVAYYLLGLSLFRCRLLTSSLLVILVMAVEWDWGAHRPLFGLLALAAVASAIRGPRVLDVLGAAPRGSAASRPRRALRTCWTHGKPLIAAGFVSSLAFWHYLDVGAYSLASIGLFLLVAGSMQPGIEAWRRPLPLLCFAAGTLPGFLAAGSYLWSQGALGGFFHNLYLQAAYQLETWGLPYPPVSELLRPLEAAGWAGWRAFIFGEVFRWYLPIVLYLLCLGYVTYRWLVGRLWSSEGCVRLLLILLMALAYFRIALGRSDLPHLRIASTFQYVMALLLLERGLAYLWSQLSLGRPRASRLVLGASMLLAVLGAGAYVQRELDPLESLERRLDRLRGGGVALAGRSPGGLERVGRLSLPASDASFIEAVVDYIGEHTEPGEPVFDFSSSAGLLFFADRPSATRYFQILYASAPGSQREVVRELEQRQVRLAITSPVAMDGVPTAQRYPIVADYLDRNFAPWRRVGHVTFSKRR